MNEIAVVRAGPLTTIQDRGRPGFAHHGVPPSGAADVDALELGNRLVGNVPGAAALEATLLGPVLHFAEAAVVALTGAETEGSIARGTAVEVGAGTQLEVGRCRTGVRAYVCVRGGIAAEATLGSCSHDLLTGLGPPPLRDGDVLRIGAAASGAPEPVVVPGVPRDPVLRVVPGPRGDWFPPEALEVLTTTRWRVAPASNRVGVRLQGSPLPRLARGELLSEGMVTGAIQVTPSGEPIVLGPDHPTTGGYPVIAVVRSGDLPRAGQLAPGTTVRFTTED